MRAPSMLNSGDRVSLTPLLDKSAHSGARNAYAAADAKVRHLARGNELMCEGAADSKNLTQFVDCQQFWEFVEM